MKESVGPVPPIDPKLFACRDLALQLLLQSFDVFFDRLEDNFLDLADKAAERQLRDCYLQARSEIQAKRELITAEFRNHFLDSFKKRLGAVHGKEQKGYLFGLGAFSSELSLVANDEYEEDLAIGSMTSEFVRTGGDDLRQLESRMASLMPASEQGGLANPISPDAICDAVRSACRQIESGPDARQVALRVFEQQFSLQVATVYRQVNEYLTQQNVPPAGFRVLPRAVGKPVSGQNAAGRPGQGETFGQSAADRPAGSTGMVSMTLPAALAAHLDHMLNGQSMQDAGAGSGARRQSMEMAFLDQLQQDGPGRLPGLDGVAVHPEQGNLLAQLQGSAWAQGLSQLDGMTLNLVSLLFDRLFEDPRLPDVIKGLIGRLQIPVLKVALLDSTFFARKTHPARQLLDRLAEAAIDWQEEGKAQRLDRLAAIVAWVVVNFEDDTGIFEQALADLESYLLAEADAVAVQILEDTQTLVMAEQQELGAAIADSVVSGRLFGRNVPQLVAEFARTWWAPVLAHAYGPAGENEPDFIDYVAALDDLLWSVEPKRGTEERLRLVNCLPGMLRTLEAGCACVGMPEDTRQSFMSELVHCHAAAIRNGMHVPAQAAEPAPAPAPDLNVMPAESPIAESVLDPKDFPSRWEWVELQETDGSVCRLRLSWISPQGTRLLFTSRDGGNGRTYTRSEVESLLRKGRLQRHSLSDGLTEDVLAGLRRSLAA